jgi:hypothetical protein
MFQHGVHSCRKYRARVTGVKVGECTGWRTEDQQQDRHCQHQSETRMERGEEKKCPGRSRTSPSSNHSLLLSFPARVNPKKERGIQIEGGGGVGRSLSNEPNIHIKIPFIRFHRNYRTTSTKLIRKRCRHRQPKLPSLHRKMC